MSDDNKSKAEAMRRLPKDVREAAIAAADNVVGYERFQQKYRQVEIRGGYRKPVKPGPGGLA